MMSAGNPSADDLALLAERIREGRLSPVELVETCLDRIAAQNGSLHAFISTDPDAARAEARTLEAEARAGRVRGPLHGLPVAVKDLFDDAGRPNTAGAAVRREHRPVQTATAVHRLRDAGAVIIGRTNLHEFAFGVTSVNPHFGAVANPWDRRHITGGSSGGSGAAVAAGLCAAALGTDTGGSIRIPAALCGIVGLKPTFGRISRHGVVPLAWSFDTVGPMTRTVADAALLMSVLAGPDPADPLTLRHDTFDTPVPLAPSSFRVGRLVGALFDEPVHATVSDALDRACAGLARVGGRLREVRIPSVARGQIAQTTILFAEAASYHRRALPGRLHEYGSDVRELIADGALIPATAYVEAQQVQAEVIGEVRALLREVDVLICPTVPVPAPRITEVDPHAGEGWRQARSPLSRLTRLFNLTGLPTLSLPAGATAEGLPVAVQLAARPGGEAALLGIAAALEAEIGRRLPPLI